MEFEASLNLSEFFTKFHHQFCVHGTDGTSGTRDEEDISDGVEAAIDRPDGDNSEDDAIGAGTFFLPKKYAAVVSVHDILSALEYREDLERHNYLLSLVKRWKHNQESCLSGTLKIDDIDAVIGEDAKSIWRRMQERVDDRRMSTDEHVINLVTAFEVWSTKAIANQILLNGTTGALGSTLLNIPSSKLLSKQSFPSCKFEVKKENLNIFTTKNTPTEEPTEETLAIAPNSLTWKELFRLSAMVSTLPTTKDRKDASNSTLTYATNSSIKNNEEKCFLSISDTPPLKHDLIALWVRAQRNTQALRHFFNLFTIIEKDCDNETMQCDQEDQPLDESNVSNKSETPEDNNSAKSKLRTRPELTVKYTGNCKHTRPRVEREPTLVDRLADWAIINQVLFTQHYVWGHNKAGEDISKDGNGMKKRSCLVDPDSNDHFSKKRKLENEKCEYEFKYRDAKEAFVLRWFARRNVDILTVLFLSKTIEPDSLDKAYVALSSASVPLAIKKYLKKKFKSTDRTFARIDRRILLGKYGVGEHGSLSDAVLALLEAFRYSLPKGSEVIIKRIREAEQDFLMLRERFLERETQYNFISTENNPSSSSSLIQLDLDENMPNDTQLNAAAEALLSYPTPWKSKCKQCEEDCSDDTDENLRTCWNCETLFHKRCTIIPDTMTPDLSEEQYNILSPLQDTGDQSSHSVNGILKSRWYCENCYISPDERVSKGKMSSSEEAKLCQAVIRRLSLEWCSLPFHEEDVVESRDYPHNMLPTEETKENLPSQKAHNKNSQLDKVTTETDSNEKVSSDTQYVSLRRLDKMMDYTQEKDGSTKGKTQFNPFYSRHSYSQKLKKLEWVEGLETNPFELLVKGISLIVNHKPSHAPGKHSTQRLQLRKYFIHFFVSWCLDYRGENKESQITTGPPLGPRSAIGSWFNPLCKFCFNCVVVNESLDEHLESTELCSSQECYETHVSLANEDNNVVRNRMLNDHTLKYDHYSSFIGSTLLIPPGDQILVSLSKVLNFTLDTENRVCEFLIASYLPRNLIPDRQQNEDSFVREINAPTDDKNRLKNGLFYLIPILNEIQLNYVLRRCSMRDATTRDWPSVEVLELEGIIELTPEEVFTRISETAALLAAMDNVVSSLPTNDEIIGKVGRIAQNNESMKIFHAEETFYDLNDPSSQWNMYFKSPFENISSTIRKRAKMLSSQIDFLFLTESEMCRSLTNKVAEDITAYENKFSNSANYEECYDSDDSLELQRPSHCGRRLFSMGKDSSNELNEENSGKNIHIVQGMVVFEDSEAAKKEYCTICYTDFIYWHRPKTRHKIIKSMQSLEKTVSKIKLSIPSPEKDDASPRKNVKQSNVHTIMLHRSSENVDDDDNDDDDEYVPNENASDQVGRYAGNGWGFELVKWRSDTKTLRVGRVAPNSPAARSGLLSHDILLAVNGCAVKKFTTIASLAKALLGNCAARRSGGIPEKCSSAPILYGMKTAVKGPVFLEVRRVENLIFRNIAPRQCLQIPLSPMRYEKPRTPNTPNSNTCSPPSHGSSHTNRNPVQPLASPHNLPPSPPQAHVHPEPIHPETVPVGSLTPTRQPTAPIVPQRQLISSEDLHTPGVNKSFLSMVEVSVLSAAVERESPYLGLRLLCPRYDLERLKEEYESRIRPYVNDGKGLNTIPQIPEETWAYLMTADYDRTKRESGPYIFQENGFSYRMPVESLPLDRLLEKYFDEIVTQQQRYGQQQQQQQQQQQYHHSYQLPMPNSQTGTRYYTSQDQDVRIRGGGGNKEGTIASNEDAKPLMTLSTHDWQGAAVFGTYTDSSSNMTATYVGTVKSYQASGTENGAFTVHLDVQHVSNKGYLHPPRTITISSNILFLVGQNYELLTKIDTWKKRDSEIGTKVINSSGKSGISLVSAAQLLTMRLRLSGTSILGYLPDGRALHWFHSDPTALYIYSPAYKTNENVNSTQKTITYMRSHSIQSQYQDIISKNKERANMKGNKSLIPCKPGMYSCLWGCAIKNNTQSQTSLAFSSKDELDVHLSEKHVFGFTLKQNSCWQRISEGNQINTLGIGLTAAICARRHDFVSVLMNHKQTSLSKTSRPRFVLNPKIALNLRKPRYGDPSYSFINKRNGPLNPSTRQLSLLFSRIARLFEVEHHGTYRLRNFLHQPVFGDEKCADSVKEEEDKMLALVRSDIKESKGEEKCSMTKPNFSFLQCKCLRPGTANALDKASCGVCHLGEEEIIRVKESEGYDALSEKQGTGCAFVSDICFDTYTNPHREELLTAIEEISSHAGELNAVKIALMKVAANVPYSLFLSNSSGKIENLLHHEIWNKKNMDIWIQFVLACMDGRMIAQAYVTLLCSINKKRMPGWWKSSRSGWHSTTAIISVPTLSKLALHIYTFDLAVSQHMTTKRSKEHSQPKVKKKLQKENEKIQYGSPGRKDKSSSPARNKQAKRNSLTEDIPTTRNNESIYNIPEELKSLSLKERMETVMEWAHTSGVPLHESAASDDYCYICENGGELLCCEFCVNVAHPRCVGFEGKMDDINWDWVCNECINDINDIRKKK